MTPVEKERIKQLNFTFQAFQAETIAGSGRNQNKNIKIGSMIIFQNHMNKIKISSLEKQTEFRQIRLKLKSQLMRHNRVKYSKS